MNKPPPDLQPLIIYANWFQFGSGEIILRKRVESRMFLWVVRGGGSLQIHDDSFQVGAGDWFFLPWAHALEYQAGAEMPFFLAGIHLLPHHDANAPVVFQVAHDPADALSSSPERADADLGIPRELLRGRFESEQAPLALLCRYLLQFYEPTATKVPGLRIGARLLVETLKHSWQQAGGLAKPVPSALFRAEIFVRKNLNRPLKVEDLAAAAGCSLATLHRLFSQYRECSPGQWLARQRAEHAATLLRTTTLKIHEIAPRVGMEDPFQFSRFFKRMTGCAPKDYRTQMAVF
jgi:AraC-like DNA-binding protein